MPSKNPRINISPSDEAHAIVEELSKLTGQSRAGIVNDLLQAAVPALRFTVESVKQYQSATSEAERLALQSVYAKAEQGLERMAQKVTQAASAALAGTGTGTGAGDSANAGGRAADAREGASAGAGAGAGAGEQGGADANATRNP